VGVEAVVDSVVVAGAAAVAAATAAAGNPLAEPTKRGAVFGQRPVFFSPVAEGVRAVSETLSAGPADHDQVAEREFFPV
jgi:hypothetical protein